MCRSVTSIVSALSGCVANGHQTLQHVSSSPSKIPYGGFSPVRLQTGRQPPPSIALHRLSAKSAYTAPARSYRGPHPMRIPRSQQARARASHSPSRSGPRGQAGLRWSSWTRQSRGPWLARGLCCPSGSSLTMASSETLASTRRLIFFVQTGLCPSTSSGLGDQSFPTFLRVSVPSCRLPYPGGPHGCTRLLLHRERWPSPSLQRLGTRSPTHVDSRVGSVTRLQSSLHATARRLACPSPTRTFTPELSPPRVAPRKRRV